MKLFSIDMEFLRKVRSEVDKSLQELRDDKIIGSSLDAEIDLYADLDSCRILYPVKDGLHFLFITSRATLHREHERPELAKESEIKGLWIVSTKSEHQKCERCYHRRRDVNLDKKYPGICYHCIDNITGVGEIRKYF